MPIQGSQNGDTIYDTIGNDRLIGHNGDDFFFLSGGNDTINGQNGFDTAVFKGAFHDFSITTDNTGNLRTNVIGEGQSAELKHVEQLIFDNGIYNVATRQFTANTVSISGGGTVTEGETLTYVVSRTGDLTHSLAVGLSSGGSAGFDDFSNILPNNIVFAAGQDTVTFTISTLNDGIYEGNEIFDLSVVADPDHFVLVGNSQTTATIIDAQTPPPVSPILHISNAQTTEGGTLVFRVSIDAAVGHDITFNARTDTGTHAVSGTDPTIVNFGTATAGNLPNGDFNGFQATQFIIPAGQTYVDIPVTTRSDLLIEGNETLSLRLSNATGATINSGIGFGRGVGTIVDLPPPPVTQISFYADANAVTEGGDLIYYFQRDTATTALDVHFWLNTFPGGGATPGVDFTADNITFTFVPGDPGSSDFMLGQDHWADASMVVHFEPGQTEAQIVFHVTDDGIAEPLGEAFALHFDFDANGPFVQFDGATSEQLYLAAYPTANPTQVNIGHIVDPVPPQDTTAPVLTGLEINNNEFDVSNEDGILHVRITGIDDIGFEEILWTYGNGYIDVRNEDLTNPIGRESLPLTGGAVTDGVFEFDLLIPQDSASGNYVINLGLYDANGNGVTYSTQQLADLGFVSQFTVVSDGI